MCNLNFKLIIKSHSIHKEWTLNYCYLSLKHKHKIKNTKKETETQKNCNKKR